MRPTCGGVHASMHWILYVNIILYDIEQLDQDACPGIREFYVLVSLLGRILTRDFLFALEKG